MSKFDKLNNITTMGMNAMACEIGEANAAIGDGTVTVREYFNDRGDFVVPVNTRPSEFTGDNGHRRDAASMCEIKINNDSFQLELTLGKALDMTAEIIETDTSLELYGCIWSSKSNSNFRLNLMHPLIADQLSRGAYSDKLDEEGKLYIYSYRKSNTKFSIDDSFADEVITRWSEVISVLRSSAYKPELQSKSVTNVADVIKGYRSGRSTIDGIEFELREEGGKQPNMVISPLTYITKGVLFPYYGALLSEMSGGEYRSRDLMHWGSINVAHSGNIGGWGTTCCGSRSNSVYKSLFVMPNLNTGSPHHTDVLCHSDDRQMRTYVKCAQDLALNIYKGKF